MPSAQHRVSDDEEEESVAPLDYDKFKPATWARWIELHVEPL